LTNLTRFNDGAWLTDNSRIWNDLLVVDDLGFRHDSLLVDDARLADHLWLINQLWLANFTRLRHDVLVDHSTLCVNDLFLANELWWLLNLYEVGSALLRWANAGTLRHAADFLCFETSWTTLEMKKFQFKVKKFIFS
jgi:hypothetical protein